ncbi:MAG: ribosome small subunit-dependent GTPase A [Mycobacteriales bacterium]
MTGRADSRSGSRLDEDDVRVRPGRGSRPRTRTRPAYADAAPGIVVAVDRGRYTVLVDDHQVTAVQARELGRNSVVVGDRVALVGDVSGVADTLARIVRVERRETVLRRSADDGDPNERVIVANADQLVVVAALADPPPRIGLIDRCLVAAYVGGLDPLLCLTKADLVASGDEADLVASGADGGPTGLAEYADLGVPAVTTRRGGDLTPLRQRLDGRVSVLVGHSGVGKSTLVNALVPEAGRATGAVSAAGRGRHISSSAVALPLPGGGWVIDTPGIRSFGLAHVTPADLLAAFPDLAEGAEDCPRNCAHLSAADGCRLDDFVASGHSSAGRLASFRRLLAARGGAAAVTR